MIEAFVNINGRALTEKQTLIIRMALHGFAASYANKTDIKNQIDEVLDLMSKAPSTGNLVFQIINTTPS